MGKIRGEYGGVNLSNPSYVKYTRHLVNEQIIRLEQDFLKALYCQIKRTLAYKGWTGMANGVNL